MTTFFSAQTRMINAKSNMDKLLFNKDLQNQATTDNELDENLLQQLQSKNITNINNMIDQLTSNLNSQLKSLNSDKSIKVLQWLNYWEYYIDIEDIFDLNRIRTYKRGDIVMTNFGFNIGNELGGTHYAIVIEANNAPTNGTVVVVPLKSTQEECPELDNSEVFLGKNIIPVGNAKDNFSIAKVGQLKAISKMRIIKPTNTKNTVYPTDSKIRNEILDLIDSKVKELFLKYEKITVDSNC